MVLAVLVGILCASATNVFAQAKPETNQEKIIRLQVENKVLSERVTSLTQEIISLQSQLAALKSSQAKTPQLKTSQLAQNLTSRNSAPAVKPYYANAQIQQKCEKWAKCAQWAAKVYRYYQKLDMNFRITEIKESLYYKEPSKIFGGSGTTVYKMYISTNFDRWERCVYTREGEGKNPIDWYERFEVPVTYERIR